MQVKQAMTKEVHFIPSSTTLSDAARKMAVMDCGFLPIGDTSDDRLKGVVTDRDIVMRAVAEGKDPDKTTVAEVRTDRVLYCYEDDDVEDAARSMREQMVYRLIVLSNSKDKLLSGIISLGDIVQQDREQLAAETVKGITQRAA